MKTVHEVSKLAVHPSVQRVGISAKGYQSNFRQSDL